MSITDWDDAYANGAYIDGAQGFPQKWAHAAATFRAGHTAKQLDIPYGAHSRQVFDLFQPAQPTRGLVVFVHGGYWKAFDKNSWSHLAAGPLKQGYSVAMPSYILAPEARIFEITQQIGNAITAAAQMVIGPLYLTGHSAGGHLVARMGCNNAPLSPKITNRISRITPISGLPDLRLLLKTSMKADLQLSQTEADDESPFLLSPNQGFHLTAWVGAKERPEFRRQNALLPKEWGQFGVSTTCHEAQNRHHFDVIDDLANPASKLCQAVLGT